MWRDDHRRPPSLSLRRRRTPVCSALLAANIAVFCGMIMAAEFELSLPADRLLDYGANYAPLTLNGQWWRLFTCLFIHAGILHLSLNMYILWQTGRILEQYLGSMKLTVLYLACGLSSSLATLWLSPHAVVQGASGALFGLIGGLMAFVLSNRQRFPAGSLRQFRDNLLLFLGINLLLGLVIEQIDLAGHAVGLITGCGFVFLCLLPPATSPSRAGRLLAALPLVVVLGLVAATLGFKEPPYDFHREMAQFTAVERECLNRYNEAQQAYRKGRSTKRDFMEFINGDLLPAWRTAGNNIAAPQDCPQTLRDLRQKLDSYVQAREQSWQQLLAALLENNSRKLALHHETWSAAERMAREISLNR